MEIIIVLLFTLINGLFAMCEIAFVSINDNKVKVKAEANDKKSKRILYLIQDPNRFLSTIQVAITLAGFLSSAFASNAFSDQFASILIKIFPNIALNNLKVISVVLITLILSYFSLVLGELVPKKIGMAYSEAVSYRFVNIIYYASFLVSPIVWFLSLSANFIVWILKIDTNNDEQATEEEIKMIIDASQERGNILDTEKRFIHNIFDFNNIPVRDIMCPRREMLTINAQDDLEKIKEKILNSQYSRIPVYQDSIDNIIGIIHVREFSMLVINNNLNYDSFKECLYKPYYVLESTECDDLFFELQKNNIHLAIVVDEYGGTFGLVTLEDLIEEIVGNIYDEHDDLEEEDISIIGDGIYRCDGGISLDRVESLIFARLPLDDYDTLSGFIVGHLERLPELKDVNYNFDYNGYRFIIEQIEDKRVSIVRIERLNEDR